MKKSIADGIEQYVKVLLARSEKHQIEIRRTEIAETFACVPSQVTYVLNTRFTPQAGYCTESHRGGQGYIRIIKLSEEIDPWADHILPGKMVDLLEEEELINKRENEMVKYIIYNAGKNLPREFKSQVNKAIISALQQFLKDKPW